MANERDLFANFERMRREMDELFGDVFGSAGLTGRRSGFSPAVDVFYADDPPRAIVHAELAGIDAGDLGLEIQGRELTLTGHRREADAEGRVYQQVEIEHGRFSREIALGTDVDARPEAGAPVTREAGAGPDVIEQVVDLATHALEAREPVPVAGHGT